ncbi:MAG: hypothetical protein EOO56_27325 [Hymenobacter sp.]|nr:MAG: hypothetical protein EOO56_27325 [Hymenobacter sp.]
MWRNRAAPGFIACMALILGGAVGNLIDSVFYGVLYHNAPGSPLQWFFGQATDRLCVDSPAGFVLAA